MTEIVRASLGRPTLRRVPSLKIPNVHIILEKEDSKYVWVIENAPASAFPVRRRRTAGLASELQ